MLWTFLACTPETSSETSLPEVTVTTPVTPSAPTTPAEPVVTDPLAGLPVGTEQWEALCSRGHDDSVSRAFCEPGLPPTITSLAALRTLLGLGGDVVTGDAPLRVTATFHSTGLGARFVTPLNPRTFFFSKPKGVVNPVEPQPDEVYTVVAFARGETFVELASKDADTEEPRFYLFRFVLPCEEAGCTSADLLTPATESSWVSYSLYDDSDVKNTTLDCLRCHQPDGPGTKRLLLMQELRNPWNHWFYPETSHNIGAIDAFEEAHGETRYADFPAQLYRPTRPSNFQALIQNNSAVDQPNEYDSKVINEELEESGRSETWDALFAASLLAAEKPVPFYGNPQVDGNWDYSAPYEPVIDPDSPLALAVAAYTELAAGSLPADAMPNLGDLWLPEALDAIGYRARTGLDGAGLLRQMCGQCHNARLDPSISRANFDVDALDTLSRAAKDEAIARLQKSDEDIEKMPPPRFHVLTDAERDAIIDVLLE